MEAEEAEADGARRPRARQRITRVNQSPFRFSIVQTALQTNFDVHRQCLKNVDLPPPRKPSFTLISCPLTKCLSFSSASWFRVPSDNQVVESQVLFNHQILLPEEGRRELDSGQDFSLIRGNGVVLFRLTTIVIRVDK